MNLGALFLFSFYEGLNLWDDQLEAKQNKPIAGPIWYMDKNVFSKITSRIRAHC